MLDRRRHHIVDRLRHRVRHLLRCSRRRHSLWRFHSLSQCRLPGRRARLPPATRVSAIFDIFIVVAHIDVIPVSASPSSLAFFFISFLVIKRISSFIAVTDVGLFLLIIILLIIILLRITILGFTLVPPVSRRFLRNLWRPPFARSFF